jgi:hypothetical protein
MQSVACCYEGSRHALNGLKIKSLGAQPNRAFTSLELRPLKEFALIVPREVNVAAPAGWSALAIERVRVDLSATAALLILRQD